MQLIELELKNFGQHKHLRLDMDDPSVGIFGVSGVGKSMVLDAIRLLLTAEVSKPPLEGYIRDRGVNFEDMDDLPKSAVARGVFRVEGGDMEIERTITASASRRKLTWEGKTYTTAEDVEKIIGELLGADRKAVSACVFPPQGELVHMLFGTQKEREELFVKLLLLSDYASIAQQFESQARLLEYGMVDRTSAKDSFEKQRFDQENVVVEIAQRLAELPDNQNLITALSNYQRIHDEVWYLRGEITNNAAQFAGLKESEMACLAAMGPSITSADDLRAVINRETLDLAQTRSLLDVQTQGAKAFQTLERLAGEYGRLQATWQADSEERARLAVRVPAAESTTLLRSRMTTILDCLGLRQQVLKGGGYLQEAAKILEVSLVEEKVAAANLAAHRDNVSAVTLRHDCDLSRIKVQVRDAVLNSPAAVSVCPLCEGAMNADAVKASVPRVRAEAAAAEAAWNSWVAGDDRLDQIYRSASIRSATCKANYSRILEEHTARVDLLKTMEESPPVTEEQLAEIQGQITAAEGAQRQLDDFDRTGKIRTVEGGMSSLAVEMEHVDKALAMNYNQDLLQTYSDAVSRVEGSLSAHQQTLVTLQGLQKPMETVEAHRVRLEDQLQVAQRKYDEVLAAVPNVYANMNVSQVLTELRACQETRHKVAGELGEARKNVERIIAGIRDIEEKDRQDGETKELARLLKEARSVFLRQGLPLTYIRYCYGRLVEMANRNLEVLDADYAVMVDKETDVAMLFSRLGDSSEAIFTMERLSGGQRVRLAVAFLLAIQQLILPNLGFLVLDEPSMHLGDDAVENMADLFSGMRSSLQSSHAQLIVCDHNELLLRSFGKVHRLQKTTT